MCPRPPSPRDLPILQTPNSRTALPKSHTGRPLSGSERTALPIPQTAIVLLRNHRIKTSGWLRHGLLGDLKAGDEPPSLLPIPWRLCSALESSRAIRWKWCPSPGRSNVRQHSSGRGPGRGQESARGHSPDRHTRQMGLLSCRALCTPRCV